MLSLRYPMEVCLHGDCRADAARAVADARTQERHAIGATTSPSWNTDWWRLVEKRAMADAKPINPQRIFWELSPRLPDNAILSADSGSCAGWWARDLKIRSGMKATLSGNLATMGPAMPYAAAAKFAFPDRPVIAAVGDGAMQMIGNNVLITIAAHYKEWKDPRLVIIVLNNGDLNQVTWEQRVMAGDPKFEVSQNLPPFQYARYAQILDLNGIMVDTPDKIVPALDEALRADRPTLIECIVDPEVPPLPPHVTFKHAKNFMSAVGHGDVHRWHMIEQAAKQVWAGMTR